MYLSWLHPNCVAYARRLINGKSIFSYSIWLIVVGNGSGCSQHEDLAHFLKLPGGGCTQLPVVIQLPVSNQPAGMHHTPIPTPHELISYSLFHKISFRSILITKYRHSCKRILRLVCDWIAEILIMRNSLDKVQRHRRTETVKFAVYEDSTA